MIVPPIIIPIMGCWYKVEQPVDKAETGCFNRASELLRFCAQPTKAVDLNKDSTVSKKQRGHVAAGVMGGV